jgi:hypothetical protein
MAAKIEVWGRQLDVWGRALDRATVAPTGGLC